MKRRLYLTPAGISLRTECLGLAGLLLLALLWSLTGLGSILRQWQWTEEWQGYPERITPYPAILGTALYGFYLIALGLPALAAWHWFYHRQGARADYLMRRLPDRWELPVRCLAVPVTGILVSLALAWALGGIYGAVYSHCRTLFLERAGLAGGGL